MKNYAKYLVIFLVLIAFGCKKSEEQKPEETTQNPAAVQPKKKQQREAPPLEIYQDDKLVATLQDKDIGSILTPNLTVHDKRVTGITLKDFLTKYDLKGKSVVISGRQVSAAISWERATSPDLYLVLGRKNSLQVLGPKTKDVRFPGGRVVRIRASNETEAAALAKEKQKAGK